ncbi:outer membrane protein transport protein [Caulobacter sp.]|uniref:outer membrane protein transport protein n=1 Tax=Caulobacter sp. TaxID=78 RepID=UPI002B471862|nr:outer membrane protein transport protein [Caulobacter sp.]HJV43778.1 outer membrane protein transport protein [Caulobacter sp.]
MSLTRNRLAAGVALLTLAAATQASASAFYLQEQSVRGAGRAYSGEVADTGVGSLWWNPASIASVEKAEIYGGLHYVGVESHVKNTGSTIRRSTTTTGISGDQDVSGPIKNGVVPNFAAAYRLNDKIVVGLSVAAPYNFTTEYNTTSWTRYDALKSRLTTADIQATVAYRLTDTLDLGLGVDAIYSDAELTNALPNFPTPFNPTAQDGKQKLKGDGWDYGWNVGAQWRPTSKLTFGASYRAKVKRTLKGDVTVSGLTYPLTTGNMVTKAQATITTPWTATVGARWAVNDRLTVNGSVSRLGWSEFDAIRVTYAGGGSTSIQDYKDITTIAVGADYKLTDKVTVRGGLQRDPTPTPDNDRTSRVPDGDRWMYAVGATFQTTPKLQLDTALNYIAFNSSNINRSDTFYSGAAATSLSGRVSGHALVMSVGGRYSF